MSFINQRDKEITCKIVYFGSEFSGKTTSLTALYRKTAHAQRGSIVTLSGNDNKTLFFDFLPLSLGKINGYHTRINVYSVPGDIAYDSSRTLILKGIDGLVFVCDSQLDRLQENLESWKNFQKSLRNHGTDLKLVPLAIQYNKRDLPNCFPIESLRTIFNSGRRPEFETVATRGTNVMECFQSVAKQALKSLGEK